MKFVILLLLSVVFSPVYAAEQIIAEVFIDVNGNGVRDAGEHGAAGVVLSNGFSVAVTGEDGVCRMIAHEKQRFLSLSTPSGMDCRGAFYRKLEHNKGGRFAFSLNPLTDKRNGFVQLSDIETEIARPWMDEARNLVKRENAGFLIITGDIAQNRKEGLTFAAREFSREKYGVPVYFALGNHDWTIGRSGEADYCAELGPLWYSFNAGGVHYVVTPMPWHDRDFSWMLKRAPEYTADEVLDWMAQDLAKVPANTPVVLFNHSSWFHRPEWQRRLPAERISAFVYGHFHHNAAMVRGSVGYFSQSSPMGGGNGIGSCGIYHIGEAGKLSRRLFYFSDLGVTAGDTSAGRFVVRSKGENSFFSQVLAGNGTVFAAVSDDANGRDGGVEAFDAASGRRLWRFPAGNSVKGAMALWSGTLLFTDVEENLYAVDGASGKEKWRKPLRFGVAEAFYEQGVVVRDGTVYAGQLDTLSAFDIGTGNLLWTKSSGKAGRGRGTAAMLTLAQKCLILTEGSPESCRYAFDPDNGKLLWKKSVRHKHLRSTPVAIDDKLLLGIGDEYCVTNPADGKTGTKYYLSGLDRCRTRPLVTADHIISGSAYAGVHALPRRPEARKWSFATKPAQLLAVPYLADNKASAECEPILVESEVIFGAGDGIVYAVNASDGKLIWQFDTGAAVTGVAAVPGAIFISNHAGKLIRLDLKKGR